MSFDILLTEEVRDFIREKDDKTRRIIKENLRKLEKPYPGQGRGDKEKLPVDGKKRFRIHIGRTWTAFYSVIEEENEVRVSEILSIDEAHKRYGF